MKICKFCHKKFATIQRISPEKASKLFGPVWHGTTEDARQQIISNGFRISEGEARQGETRHGYEDIEYVNGVPPPVHHLGYGVYFTTNKTIAKMFNRNTTKGLTSFYLDIPRLVTINFASPVKMMHWWIEHGYDPDLAATDRVAATKRLTATLRASCDAVWFKGRGMKSRLLDGDQICVYDADRIFVVDKSLVQSGEIGSKVRRVSVFTAQGKRNRQEVQPPVNSVGTILDKRNVEGVLDSHPAASTWLLPDTKWVYTIDWGKKQIEKSVLDSELEFI